MCDSGSQIGLITIQAVKKLGLKITPASMNIFGAQGQRIGQADGKVILAIPINSTHYTTTTFYVVPKISKNLPEEKMAFNPQFRSLRLADPNFQTPGEIEALFGIDVWVQILLPNIIYHKSKSIAIAQETSLGYVIFQVSGNTRRDAIVATQYITPTSRCTEEAEILTFLQKFWEVEDLPKIKYLSNEEKECERIFMETHSRLPDGRYVVTMPFNDKLNSLGRSKNIAIRQFFFMERKMRNEQFRAHYIQFMKEHEERGFMTRTNETIEDGYYTPHHGVFSSNKFRVVFNASCPTTTGVSLNECQLTGEKLQGDLAYTLLRFRTFKIAICADVKAMYCQIEIADHHKKYQKIIWRESDKEPLHVYVLNRVAYGQTSAPFLAIRAMQQCASDYTSEFPEAAKHIMESFYVDDLLTGADDVKNAIKLRQQLIDLLSKGKFELAKWCSNSKQINAMTQASPTVVEINDETIKSVLGLCWLPGGDFLTFKVTELPTESQWTKRKILSNVGKLYDPNGCMAPIVVVAKILIQSLWRSNLDWDEPIDATIKADWLNFLNSLKDINKIKIPRWLQTSTKSIIELHGFSDASESAYAAVIYARSENEVGIVTSNLIFSKTRVSPLKKLSIPRLELCGAYLLAKLMKSIRENFSLPIEHCYYWTDSEVVLQWLHKSPSNLKTFVANRVAYIQHETTDKGGQWQWLPGAENPADVASRGCSSSTLHDMSLWWHGPNWLTNNRENWPSTNKTNDDHHDHNEINWFI